MRAQSFSHISLSVTPWTVAHQAPPFHGDSPGKNIGVGGHAFLQGIFPTQGLNPHPLNLLQKDSFTEPPGKPRGDIINTAFAVEGVIYKNTNQYATHLKLT